MKVNPRYGDQPLLATTAFVDDPATPLLRQRNRLADLLDGLDDAQWSAPSRCEGWSVKDVAAHLTGVNRFWALTITSGAKGEPTRVLTDFDPVATPAQLVDAIRGWSAAETLAKFRKSNHLLAAAVEALDESAWSALGETPLGHVSLRLVALHALWDSWVHERDIALPLGLTPVEEPDEVRAALVYAAALGPAFLASTESGRTGVLGVRATEPDVHFVIEVGPTVVLRDGPAPDGAPAIAGSAVALVEGLSLRAPLDVSLADDDRWLLGRLDQVFDQAD